MAKVIKFPKQDKKHPYAEQYATFVDDLGGFLWHIRMASHMSFQGMAQEIGVSEPTLRNLANRVTKNPQGRTIWAVLKGLDNRNIIRHSMLEQYRPLNKKDMDNLKALEKKKSQVG